MSSDVSQINYWKDSNSTKSEPSPYKKEADVSTSAVFLSYDTFLGLSVIGGLLALDHLYLRSPHTFLAKLIVNIITFGSWWLYDASQAIFNRDVVKVFGLGIPGFGMKGIGAGVLSNNVPDKNHLSFFIYSIALLFGGLFGIDSFIVGDKQSGIIRLICLITGILAPIAIGWWIFNIGKFFLRTKDVTKQYWKYFGLSEPSEDKMSIGEKILSRIPIVGRVVNIVDKFKDEAVNDAENLVEAIVENPVNTVESVIGQKVNTLVKSTGNTLGAVIKPMEQVVEEAIQPVLEPVMSVAEPFKETLNSGIQLAQSGLNTVQNGISLGRDALNTGSKLVERTLNVVGETADSATKALTLLPSAATLSSGLTTRVAQSALSTLNQTGGNLSESDILSKLFMGTLGLIVVSGLVLTYRRSRYSNGTGKQSKNDEPPKPGVF